MNVAHEYSRPHYIGPDECLDGRIFYLCNPAHFCRLKTCSVLRVPSKHLVYVRSKTCPDPCKRKRYSIFLNWVQAGDEIMILFHSKDSLFMSTGFDLGLTLVTSPECFWKTQVQLYSTQQLYFARFNNINHFISSLNGDDWRDTFIIIKATNTVSFSHFITQVETTETAEKEESKLFFQQCLFSVYVWIQHVRK